MGSVNSKQDRVAAMAFMSSVVEGVGKAIQAAQTTQQTNALGGSQAIVTGDSMSYMAAGGASNAASMVTQWYLKQAQNLLPTINVGSGQNVWIVMQDKVALPTDYFRKNSKGDSHESVYTYFSRLVD
jgi:conjugal transfer pilus assembly protein TraB